MLIFLLENSSNIQFKNEIEAIVAIPYSFWCFGLIKLKYRRSQISSVFELARVVNTSTQKEINLAQLIVDTVSKKILLQVYDWQSYFEIYFRKVPNIIRYHHFRFDATKPGLVFIKQFR